MNGLICSGDPTAADLAQDQVIAARPLPVGGGVHRFYGGLVLVDGEEAQRDVAALLAHRERTAEETALAFAEMLLRRMHSQSSDERVLYFLTVQPLDPERREAWEETVRFDRTLASDVRLGSLEDDTMVVVYGDAISLVSYTAERHDELKSQLESLLGEHVVASELGIHADVLQEEVEVLHAELLGRSGPDRSEGRESFDGAILTRLFETAIAQCLRANSELDDA